tara:strand:+ start:188967 stop:190562 length:1596 start_codon:yes stop_codon:yes gene_type:complete
MVNLVTVIEKAVDGLNENTPEMREKVYSKARAAIGRQLDNINPPISETARQRQMLRLEEAITEIESRNADALPELDDDIFADILADEPVEYAADETYFGEEEDEPEELFSEPEVPFAESEAPFSEPEAPFAEQEEPFYADEEQEPVFGPEMDSGVLGGDIDRGHRNGGDGAGRNLNGEHVSDYLQPQKSRSGGLLMIALVVLAIVAILAIGGFLFRDSISQLVFGPSGSEKPASMQSSAGTDRSAASNATASRNSVAGNDENSNRAGNSLSGADGDNTKFTQRLLSDGTEVQGNSGTGSAFNSGAEGKSTAVLDISPSQTVVADNEIVVADNRQLESRDVASPPIVGQKMFLYEERLGQEAPTAEQGTVVWSIVRESPGDNLPPEPAIQAQINIPGKSMGALMTIKRNADQSLPASHLIEILFDLGGNFTGNGIKSVQNFALKQTEQDTGDSLIAVPAQITDTFFMIALNDYVEAVQLNLRLLRERNWIDLPVSYGNGRRALLTLEKGSTGAEVFDQVIRAWEAHSTSDSQ